MKTLQKLSVVASTAILALGVSAGSAQAGSLIGQTINADYLFPDYNTVYQPGTTTVTADSSDTINFWDGVYLDPNAQGFSITSLISGYFTGISDGATFNGIKASNLSFGDGSFITGVLIGTKTGAFTAFDSSRLSFTGDSVSLNFQGLGMGSEGYFQGGEILNVSFQTSPRPVPVPRH